MCLDLAVTNSTPATNNPSRYVVLNKLIRAYTSKVELLCTGAVLGENRLFRILVEFNWKFRFGTYDEILSQTELLPLDKTELKE